MLEKLRELGIRDDLIDEIKKFRESYPAEKSYEARIPKLEQFYYGKDVWEQAITAILCGQNLLLVGHKATGKNLFAENLAGVFMRPRWDVSFHVNMDAASLIGMDTFRGGEVTYRPASLIFSMVMRFLPNYRRQIGRISGAQKGMGVSVSDGSLKSRIRHGAKIVSIMFTWALENSIETADSMRARGYGLKGRSSFSIYRFDRRDAATTVYILISAGVIAAALASGKCRMEFYPDVVMAEPDILGIAAGVVYALLCFMPVMMQAKEVILWKYLKSKI